MRLHVDKSKINLSKMTAGLQNIQERKYGGLLRTYLLHKRPGSFS